MTTYALNDEKMFADITDGIAIVINSETGIYYGFNGLGSAVLQNIINGVAIEKILASLQSAGAPADIETKLKAFVADMQAKDMLIVASDNGADADIDAGIAKEDNFELKLDEYNDAQEMLLADPIHEVKEEQGWTPEKSSIGYSKEETHKREEKVEE